MRQNTFEDLLLKVNKTESCWLWTGLRWQDRMGYARCSWKGESRLAHIVFHEVLKGPVPQGLIVRHSCDNPICVNPAHLNVGTHQDNSDDCVKRGRQSKGETHGRALVTAKEVAEIRDLLKCGLFSQSTIGKFYGVKRSLVSDINGNRCWRL